MTKHEEIKNELEDLFEALEGTVDQINQLLKGADGMVYERANAYWLGALKQIVEKDTGFVMNPVDTFEELDELIAKEENVCHRCG
ncbi:MAG: hypothetical protein PHI12_13135 [Dehalococcoidales bacterium]|nr:hypothetical protein [Dehalococcoidales bacterium]